MKLKDHLEKLEYFFEVAHEGSFRRAAQKLSISQPSLTRAVAILEDAVGSPLFIRKLQKISLTPQGEILMRYCDQLFAGLNDLEHRLKFPGEALTGIIRVGTYDSIAIYFWPYFLKAFAAKFPSIKIDLRTGRSASISQDLILGQVDFSVTIEPVLNSNFEVVELYRDTFDFYRATHTKASSAPGQPVPIILMADALSTRGEMLENSLSKHGLDLEKRYVVSSLETAKEFAKNGLGIAVLPTQVARTHVLQGSLQRHRLKGVDKFGEHRICAACAKERLKLPIFNILLNELRDFLPGWLKR